ncbi:MAG: hypothetical protein J5I52_12090 [Saprospiraceae bacterium]|nr:MAG: LVIVD repeat-containing protein [Bacteroidetes bacterium OLB9]MCO6464877.1 hypothetical protein [Saprospiraceae bacterium]MCZ2336854.1 hypothetical protein [Chitinophagales bacterium]
MRYHLLLTLFITMLAISCGKESFDNATTTDIKSGSYATMLTIGNRLYVVSKTQLTTYDVNIPASPVQLDRKDVGFDIESLFYHEGLLLIGSANNMYIYRIDHLGIPVRESANEYSQLIDPQMCTRDPIVARGSIAYVTLSTALQECSWNRFVNELRIYDISDIQNVKQLNVIGMSNPRGLGLGKNHLFVCDEFDGLVVFNIDNPLQPRKVKNFTGYKGHDLIVNGNVLVVVSDTALYQYDITDETNIKPLSVIYL